MSSDDPSAVCEHARALRAAFDAGFAALPPALPPPSIALLLVRAGGEWLALKRADVVGFARNDAFVAAPGRHAAFLGLAALRGTVYPVWSLGTLLGHAAAPAAVSWLVLTEARRHAPCAFAFEHFDRIMSVAATAFTLGDARQPGRYFAAAVVPSPRGLVPVIDLAQLQAELCRKLEPPPSTKS